MQKQMKSMMQGAFILTLASFIAKLLSAVYRVPYQNLVGDEGFYVYQQVYPIYGLAMTLALSGLPQFISKFVAQAHSPKEQATALERLYPLVFWSSLLLWAGTFFGADLLASGMGNQQLTPVIQIVAFTFLFVPPLAFYRGGFQGNLLMVPTAISQVVEQTLRVAMILLAAVAFRYFGWDYYQTGTWAMSGALLGGLVAWLILAHYQKQIHGHRLPLLPKAAPWQLEKGLLRRFLLEGGLLTVFSGFLIFFQLVDSFVIANALEQHGLTPHAARVAKGIYDRGQPLVQLGLVVAMAMSSTFLPALTHYLTSQKDQLFYASAKIYLRLTTSLAAAASVGLALLLPFVNFTLFKDFSGNSTLTIFVFAIFLMAVIQAYQSLAQSQNHFAPSVKAALAGIFSKVILTLWLTRSWGTVGASLATILGLLIALFVLSSHESHRLNAFWREDAFMKKLIFCLAVMTGLLMLYYAALYLVIIIWSGELTRWLSLLICLLGVIIGGSGFLFTAIQVKLFTLREWLMLPFGKKLLRFRKR